MRWRGIIIHHSACPDSPALETDDIKRWHLAWHWLDVGYHFLIEQVEDGFWMVSGRPLYMNGAHALGYNSTHIGICFVGNFSLAPPAQALLEYGAHQIRGLLTALEIPAEAVLAHRDVNLTECPGTLFDMLAFRALLKL